MQWTRQRIAALPVLIVMVVAALCTSCAQSPSSGGDRAVVRVPQDAATVSKALELVAENGLVLLGPGVYREQVKVAVAGVTIRGSDRNSVVIDGEGTRQSGIVVTAPGVTVENLTVRNHNFYGVLVTGMPGGGAGPDGPYSTPAADLPLLQRFRVNHVTAANNGLYGIYSFHSQHGVIENSYASGSADSGIYVGQCRECDIVVRGNIAERNAVGFENANASDSVYLVGNRWSGNRVGMTFISSYQEALWPQRANTVVGNVVTNNTEAQSPAQADGGYGIGIGISGGQNNTFDRNLVAGNPFAGVLINNAEDLAATGNFFVDNQFDDNGVDVADTSDSRAAGSTNCLMPAGDLDLRPKSIGAATCRSASAPTVGINPSALPSLVVPPGVDFLRVPSPKPQPNSPTATSAEAPAPLPPKVGAPDLAAMTVPAGDLLAEWASVR